MSLRMSIMMRKKVTKLVKAYLKKSMMVRVLQNREEDDTKGSQEASKGVDGDVSQDINDIEGVIDNMVMSKNVTNHVNDNI